MRRRDRAQRRPSGDDGEDQPRLGLPRSSPFSLSDPSSPSSSPRPSSVSPPLQPASAPLFFVPFLRLPQHSPPCSDSVFSSSLAAALTHPRAGIFLSRCLTELQQLRMHTQPFASLSSLSSLSALEARTSDSAAVRRLDERRERAENLLPHVFLNAPARLSNLLAAQQRKAEDREEGGGAQVPRMQTETDEKATHTGETDAPRSPACRTCGGFALQVYIHLNGLLGWPENGEEEISETWVRSSEGSSAPFSALSQDGVKAERQTECRERDSSATETERCMRQQTESRFLLHFTLEVYADHPFESPCLFFRRLVSLADLIDSKQPEHLPCGSHPCPSSFPHASRARCSTARASLHPWPRCRVLAEEMKARLVGLTARRPSAFLTQSVLSESWMPSLSLVLLLRRLCAFLLVLSLQLTEQRAALPPSPETREQTVGRAKDSRVEREAMRCSTERRGARRETRENRDAFWLCATLQKLRGLGKPTVCLLLLFVLLLRAALGLHPYSGEGRMQTGYGDFEAQRHWMEIAFNLPIAFWYTYGTYTISPQTSPSSSSADSFSSDSLRASLPVAGRRSRGVSELPLQLHEDRREKGEALHMHARTQRLWWPLDYPPLSAFFAGFLAPFAFLVHPPSMSFWTWRRHARLHMPRGDTERKEDREGKEEGDTDAGDQEEHEHETGVGGREEREARRGEEEGGEWRLAPRGDRREGGGGNHVERKPTNKSGQEERNRHRGAEAERDRQRRKEGSSATREEDDSALPQFRGIEEDLLRVFMRWTVVIFDFLVFGFASLYFCTLSSPAPERRHEDTEEEDEEEDGRDSVRIRGCGDASSACSPSVSTSRSAAFSLWSFCLGRFTRSPCACASPETQAFLALLLLLLSPPLLLVDDGHYQYNGVALGFVVAAAALLLRRKDLLCAVCFTLALLFKQTTLYFAPAFFAVLLSRATQRVHFQGSDFGCMYSLMATFSLFHLMEKDALVFPAVLLLLAFFFLSSLLVPHLRPPAPPFDLRVSLSSLCSQRAVFLSTQISGGNKVFPSSLSAPRSPFSASAYSGSRFSRHRDFSAPSRLLSEVVPALLQLPGFPMRRVYIHLRFAVATMRASLFPASLVVSPAASASSRSEARDSRLRSSATQILASLLSRKRAELDSLRAQEAAVYIHLAEVLNCSGMDLVGGTAEEKEGVSAGLARRCRMHSRSAWLSRLFLLLSPAGGLVAAAVLAILQVRAVRVSKPGAL
ncbi:ALG6, ALG8 glycosyltransferase family domain-containing protein [Neospora caninum Liverpool]|uniref:dolichyl-P-Glc:Man9GlcNAc2-PP-dolichol alpha-1,3-glucosyltransferase n=1 Tax=Neospora caninum (strain Liverpool) TaxID=572307 RepID=F0VGC7_NEOCL|nr:ALG6, ALG8 glycosyltransferase family domain-containing protein [Neospora caninum Liverpool]CBZ52771.1 ALG6, ALG8 glycosyltransferase family domain-containing protein [Neospora caninum Liverpool]|eukprot:XP_003882803.1 ALG6, ALG8 glycosyltransferase family domain-containing protein [Neospora caninum Liverpool]